ncbi:O-antigen ligase family protein [Chloroflexus sp.]|uniref:O-antigen ligase family protein n=1 Tax=Chloroflexus sp. TaxID=1904827 RepID=UPI002ADE40C1|nr:O-antigen ligase family protein [Chloroflexus sp.]
MSALEKYWIVTALTVVSGAFGILIWQPAALILFYMLPSLLIYHKQQAIDVSLKSWPIWLVVVWGFISSQWSRYPFVTISWTILLLLSTLVGLLMAVRYEHDTIEDILQNFASIIILFGVIGNLFNIASVMNTIIQTDRWSEIFYDKNIAGRIYAFSFIIFLLKAEKSRSWQRLLWMTLCLCSVVLIRQADSATALITVILVTVVFACWKSIPVLAKFAPVFRKRLPQLMVISMTVIIPIAVLMILYLDAILGLIGRSSQLSGRTKLWDISQKAGWESPVLGFGYGTAFVEIPTIAPLDTWMIHAHNLYLELWLQLGIIGFIIVISLIVFVLLLSIQSLYTDEKSRFSLLFITFVLAYSVTESDLISAKVDVAWVWVMFSYLYFSFQQQLLLKTADSKRGEA